MRNIYDPKSIANVAKISRRHIKSWFAVNNYVKIKITQVNMKKKIRWFIR